MTRIEVCENDVNMASRQAIDLAAQYSDVSQNLSSVIQQVHKLRADWNDWNGNDEETQQYDHENQEEIFHDPAEQSTTLVPVEDPVIQRSDLQDRCSGHSLTHPLFNITERLQLLLQQESEWRQRHQRIMLKDSLSLH